MRARRAVLLAVVSCLGAACGDDAVTAAPPGQATPAPAGAGGAPGAGSGSGKLQPQTTIEDRVICLVESNPQKKCDPKAPKCEKATDSCITNTDGSFCGPCKERDAIRHPFKPRDFVATFETRDPFQSFIVTQPGIGAGSDDPKVPLDPTRNCTREDQMVAQSYSYQDLKLVGIVTQGTQRKVLMLDTTNLGHIIKRGDCVGKEKAVVKEIGKEFITFEVQPEAGPGGAKREPEQRSVMLYPKQVPVSSLPSEPRGAPAAPVVEPPAVAPGEAPPARPPERGPTRIQVVPPPPQGPVVPPPPPTTLTP